MRSQIIDVTAPLHVIGAFARGDKDVAQTFDIVQNIGDSPIDIMSQQAVTKAISDGIVFESYNKKQIDEKDTIVLNKALAAIGDIDNGLEEYDPIIRKYIDDSVNNVEVECKNSAHLQDLYYSEKTLNEAKAYVDKMNTDIIPTVDMEYIPGGVEITITDAFGEHSANVYNGPKGDPGKSPIIQTGTWWIYDNDLNQYVDTGVSLNSDYVLTKDKVEAVLTGDITSHNHDSSYLKDAPTTGGQYVRQNGAWNEVTIPDTSIYVVKETGKGLSTNDYTTEDKTKLEGIEAGAQVNTVTSVAGKTGAITLLKTDVNLGNVDNTSDLNKPISTATKSYVDNAISTIPTPDVSGQIAEHNTSDTAHADIRTAITNITNSKGLANGIASLDSTGKVPSAQLPSYVDDVIEFDTKLLFPTIGEDGKIYIDKSTNLTWRWTGTTYVEISPSLALGETSSTAYAGDKGKAVTDKVNLMYTNAQIDTKLSTKADTTLIPTKISQLTNDSNYIITTDERLSNARPASDVSAWAKASVKPTYTASEVGAKPEMYMQFDWFIDTEGPIATISNENYAKLVECFNNKITFIIVDSTNYVPCIIYSSETTYEITMGIINTQEVAANSRLNAHYYDIVVDKTTKAVTISSGESKLPINTGDGTQYLANDGTYKTIDVAGKPVDISSYLNNSAITQTQLNELIAIVDSGVSMTLQNGSVNSTAGFSTSVSCYGVGKNLTFLASFGISGKPEYALFTINGTITAETYNVVTSNYVEVKELDLTTLFYNNGEIKTTLTDSEYQQVVNAYNNNVASAKIPFLGGSVLDVNMTIIQNTAAYMLACYVLYNGANDTLEEATFTFSVDKTTKALSGNSKIGTFKEVSFTGDYNDLINKPTITNDFTNDYKAQLDKLTGVNTVTTLASLPVNKRSITATLATATNISLANDLIVGDELIIRCVPSAAFTQPIPTTGGWSSMSGTSFDTTSGVVFEISIWCYAASSYAVVIKESE